MIASTLIPSATSSTLPNVRLLDPSLDSACFKPCDIRAIVGDSFNEKTYAHLGQAYAYWLKNRLSEQKYETTSPWVVLGWDARVHSEAFADVLTQSLMAAGISVLCLGQVPSPLVYFAEKTASKLYTGESIEPVGSIVITASHNPSEYNGLKFTFQGKTVSSSLLQELKANFEHLAVQAQDSPTRYFSELGEQAQWDIIEPYIQWHQKEFSLFASRPTVVIDSGNATAGCVVPALLRRLGCHVISIFEEADGRFPNHHPDPSAHENLKDLQAKVLECNADLGIAFDGDSDRLGVVTDKGDVLPGDQLLIVLMRYLAKQPAVSGATSPVCVVTEVKCSQQVFEEAKRLNLACILSPTGHTYIKETMNNVNALLGGELSGHVFFRDRHWGFDDAIYAALRLIEVLESIRSEQPTAKISTLTDTLPQTFLSKEKRIAVQPKARQYVLQSIQETLQNSETFAGASIASIDKTDGIRINLPGGFWLVRSSNTEPCLTIRCEAGTQIALEKLEAHGELWLQSFLDRIESVKI